MTLTQQIATEADRIKHGIQCPECFGVRIERREDRFFGVQGFQCVECGCQYGAPLATR
jgi:transposase-like protein